MPYQITLFSNDGNVNHRYITEEYPEDIPHTDEEWIDVCRLDVDWTDLLDHKITDEENTDCCEIDLDYLLGETL